MGKGTILSGGTGGLYTVRLDLDWTRLNARIATLASRIAALETAIAGMDEGAAKSRAELRLQGLRKAKALMESYDIEGDLSLEVSAWCADLTEDLAGQVGTIEVPGERGAVQIRPGYGGAAAYSTSRDGALQQPYAGTPAGCFWNLAMMPGWQRWMPTFRHGTVIAIDYGAGTCSVDLDAAASSQQGLDINQASSLSGVGISYMDVDAAAFVPGDEVLVEFQGQDWESPRVIGFKTNPRADTAFFLRITGIDGNALANGGQNVRVAYGEDAYTAWRTAPNAAEQAAGATRGLCGPFAIPNLAGVETVTVQVDGSWDWDWTEDAGGDWYDLFRLPTGDPYQEKFYFAMTHCTGLDPPFYYVGGPYTRDYHGQSFAVDALTFDDVVDPVWGPIRRADVSLTLGILGPYDVSRRLGSAWSYAYDQVSIMVMPSCEIVAADNPAPYDYGEGYGSFCFLDDVDEWSYKGSQLEGHWAIWVRQYGYTDAAFDCVRKSPPAAWF